MPSHVYKKSMLAGKENVIEQNRHTAFFVTAGYQGDLNLRPTTAITSLPVH